MRRSVMVASAIALMVGASNLAAQAKDFSGKWTLVPDTAAAAAAAGRGGRGGLGASVTIAQDAKTFTMTRTGPNGDTKTVYNLDGSDSKNAGRGGEVISNAKWVGSNLVITTKNANGDRVQTFSMDAGGDMWVESPGGQGATTKSHYKKG